MSTFVLAFVVIGLAIAGMAVGVMCGRPAIRGTCGGVGEGCELCAGAERCRRADQDEPGSD